MIVLKHSAWNFITYFGVDFLLIF